MLNQLPRHPSDHPKIAKKIDLTKKKNNIKSTAQKYQDDRNHSNLDIFILTK